jgi:hypothetical protein
VPFGAGNDGKWHVEPMSRARGADGVLSKSKRFAKHVITSSDARWATLIGALLLRNASVSSDLEVRNVDTQRRCDECAMDWKWDCYCILVLFLSGIWEFCTRFL